MQIIFEKALSSTYIAYNDPISSFLFDVIFFDMIVACDN